MVWLYTWMKKTVFVPKPVYTYGKYREVRKSAEHATIIIVLSSFLPSLQLTRKFLFISP